MDFSEKRRHPRKDVFTAALLVCGDEGYLSEVWDLSAGGARLGKPSRWPTPPPELARIFFMLDQDTVIGLNAKIVRTAADHLGVMFLEGQESRIQTLLYEARFLDID